MNSSSWFLRWDPTWERPSVHPCRLRWTKTKNLRTFFFLSFPMKFETNGAIEGSRGDGKIDSKTSIFFFSYYLWLWKLLHVITASIWKNCLIFALTQNEWESLVASAMRSLGTRGCRVIFAFFFPSGSLPLHLLFVFVNLGGLSFLGRRQEPEHILSEKILKN